MRFLLLYPPTDTFSLDGDEHQFLYAPPLGILYLAAVLQRHGHEVKVIDMRGEEQPRSAVRTMIPAADAVGMTVPTFALNNARETLDLVRDIDSQVPVIVGGPHPTLYPERTLDDLPADMLVVGEAENSILDVAAYLEGRLAPSEGRGFYYREGNRVHRGAEPETVDDLDKMPFPLHHLVDRYEYGYSYGFKLFPGKTTAVLTSRGCPRRCRFCSRKLLSMDRFRTRSASDVVAELDMLYRQGYETVIIADDNFTTNPAWVHRIMDDLLERDVQVTLIVNGARVDAADRTLYEKMWNAGVRMISFGLESGCQDILDFYHKDITLKQIRRAVQLSSQAGFFTIGNFILGAPFETGDHMQQTIDFACSLPLDMAEFFILRYMPGSQLWDEAVAAGKISRDEHLVESDADLGLSQFSHHELRVWKGHAYRQFYLRPQYVARELRQFLMRTDARILRAGLSLLTILLYRTTRSGSVWQTAAAEP